MARAPLIYALLTLVASSATATKVAVVPVEYSGKVTAEQAGYFYDSLLESLVRVASIEVVERGQIQRLLVEHDLSTLLTADDRNLFYKKLANELKADRLAVPAVTRVGADYYMSLRQLDSAGGRTLGFDIRTTRDERSFSEHARSLIASQFDSERLRPTSQSADSNMLSSLVSECRKYHAPDYFPALWERAEKLRSRSEQMANPAELNIYYASMLALCAAAAAPPENMVFVPGGFVNVGIAGAQDRVWVEPFYVDLTEVCVTDYIKVIGTNSTDKMRPITQNDPHFNQPDYPVTGITWNAAQAYSARIGKKLPTRPQWLRAALAHGETPQAAIKEETANSISIQATPLMPVNGPTRDMSPLGIRFLQSNVREWTDSWDYVNTNGRPRRSNQPQEDGTQKIVMGGSWRLGMLAPNSNDYTTMKPGEAADDLGFRCVLPFTLRISSEDIRNLRTEESGR